MIRKSLIDSFNTYSIGRPERKDILSDILAGGCSLKIENVGTFVPKIQSLGEKQYFSMTRTSLTLRDKTGKIIDKIALGNINRLKINHEDKDLLEIILATK